MIRTLPLWLCCLLLPAAVLADEAAPAAPAAVPSPELVHKFGYAIGQDIAKSLQPLHEVLDMDALKRGLDDGTAAKPGPYTADELKAAKTEMGELLQARMKAAREALASAHLKTAQAFLEKNAKRKGVITTASGLQYEVLKAAKGEHPRPGGNITVHYRGTLADGTEFDSSYARGEPVSFPLKDVIPAWIEGLQLMSPGAKFKLFVPPALGYGERGAGDRIGPNELLIFEVELISIDLLPTASPG